MTPAEWIEARRDDFAGDTDRAWLFETVLDALKRMLPLIPHEDRCDTQWLNEKLRGVCDCNRDARILAKLEGGHE